MQEINLHMVSISKVSGFSECGTRTPDIEVTWDALY